MGAAGQHTPLGADPADLRMALEMGHLATREESDLLVRLLTRVAADLDGPPPWRPADLDDLLQGRCDGLSTLRWLKQVRDRAQLLVPFDLHPVFDQLELDTLGRQDARGRVERTLATASDPIVRLDHRGRVDQVSPGLLALLGRAPELLGGHHLGELCTGQGEASLVFDGLQCAHRDGVWQGAITLPSPCGDPIPVTVRLERRDDDGGRLWAHLQDARSLRQRLTDRRVQLTRDPVTGLAKAPAVAAQLRAATHRHERTGERLGVVHVALDDLPRLRASLGPAAQDLVVHTVGRRLLSAFRQCDDLGYLGHGHFVALVERVCDPVALGQRLAEVHRLIGKTVRHGAWQFEPRISVGVAFLPDDATDKADVLHAARAACDAAQRDGGGRSHFASADVARRVERTRALREAAQRALAEGRVEVVLQPQVDLATGALVSAECLARWTDPELGAVSPQAFVPLFEAAGLAAQLGRHVVNQALAALAALDEAGLGVPQVSVNLTPSNLLDPDLLPALRDAADRAGVSLSRLEVEFPSQALDHPELPELLTRMAALRATGISISLDDAGLDCLRLAQLHEVPVDRMKIDGLHVAALRAGRPAQWAALDAMVTFARQTGLRLTAEGVEDPSTLQTLREHAFPTAQGYALARPRPLAAILADGWQVQAA
ncbi:MAG: EAL domain-containing protein [Myxococcales bacterium]|nr:EAL domain-containing protein [Myxococcales bacterium]MCB9522547.1 EAL domain-containing protein [Myxococcales bacterium]